VRTENGIEYGDLPKFVDFDYVANVARVNAATLASLASAPAPPANVRLDTGKLENDTTLTWEPARGASLYEVVWRATSSPEWEHAQKVGNTTRATLKLSKDNVIFAVRAVDNEGHPSLPVCRSRSAEHPLKSGRASRQEKNLIRRSGREMTLSFPPFTKAVIWLLAINTVAFLGLSAFGTNDSILWVYYHIGLVPSAVVLHLNIWQIVTYSFIHVDFWHWFGNMLGIWMFGSTFESSWGTRRFLELFFTGVIGAALTTIILSFAHILTNPSLPTVGASGECLPS